MLSPEEFDLILPLMFESMHGFYVLLGKPCLFRAVVLALIVSF